jgi:catalase
VTAPAHSDGGETHQRRTSGPALTTEQGVVIADGQNSLTAGTRGPTVLSDFLLRNKIFHFDHERIPERVVHARGYGAHGFFECTQELSDITRAAPFAAVGERTDVFVRFSTVAGNKGSADLVRDVRGFAVKFYTSEGNWDLVGNNIPVFFIQDAIKFPDLIHAVKDEPDRGFPQAQSAHDNFWDFVSLMPESTHMVLWQMSDRTIPRSFRFMEGFGVHTFRFVNAAAESTYVKFHWKPVLGCQSVLWNEAVKINGADPDYHRRDLWNSITTGQTPQWDLAVQLFNDDTAERFEFDILDATKIIPQELVPLQIVGRLTLDRVVDNFFAETEQVAFCTQNVIPGIDFTNDPLLAGRNFSYLDTQLKRLGSPNFAQLPVNAPRCPVAHFLQDGHMAFINPVGRVNYEPNSWQPPLDGPREDPERGYHSHPDGVSGEQRRHRPELFGDHFSQARQFWISQTDVEQQHIVDAFVFELAKCEETRIRERMVGNLGNVDAALAAAVARGLGLSSIPAPPLPARQPLELPPTAGVSMLATPPATFAGRRLGILVGDGADVRYVNQLQRAALDEGATAELIAQTVGGFVDAKGAVHPAHHSIEGGPSVLFDAVAIIATEEGAADLSARPAAVDFVSDAHHHCKVMAFTSATMPLLESAGVSVVDAGHVQLDGKVSTARQFLRACRQLRVWEREVAVSPITASPH